MAAPSMIKRAVIIALLAAPALWLVFTPEGQRQTDLFLLGIGGEPDIGFGFDKLHREVSVAQLRREEPDLELNCKPQDTPFGSRLCQADIAGFNGTPARYIIFYFGPEYLNAVKIGYQRSYHGRVAGQLHRDLGTPKQSTEAAGAVINRFPAGEGIIVIPDSLAADQEPALMWLSGR